MNKIEFEISKLDRPEYIEDTKRIVKVSFDNGVILSLKEAEDLWQEHSSGMAAGWLYLPNKDEDLWAILSGKEI